MRGLEFELLARRKTLQSREVMQIWSAAARYDKSLTVRPRLLPALAKKRVVPMAFSRAQLFQHMASCRPVLFSNDPIKPRSSKALKTRSIVEELQNGFKQSERARVRVGDSIEYLAIPHILERWTRAKAVFGVTDFHYIGSRFDAAMDTKALNDFNLLPRGTDGFQSQDSLVISSEGAVTDSHSDDHSGSNHSFVGAKLWLLWDTIEGFEHGLEDVERCTVYGQAAFNITAFAAMRSSCWILIGPGQTMFIPAHLTHKVITLQRYLGLGSFHAGLPGFLDLLMRWNELPPLWVSQSGSTKAGRYSIEFITRRAIRRIRHLKNVGRAERYKWGVPYLKARLRRAGLASGSSPKNQKLAQNANLRAFISAARQL